MRGKGPPTARPRAEFHQKGRDFKPFWPSTRVSFCGKYTLRRIVASALLIRPDVGRSAWRGPSDRAGEVNMVNLLNWGNWGMLLLGLVVPLGVLAGGLLV